jgi:predicted small metal-binding protein
LNQILFVTSGRFTEEEVKAYNLLRAVFFAEDIGKYTTIVRTKFPSFRNSEKCKIDKEKMIAENEEIAGIVRSCKKLIHVNNLTKEEDPELKSRKECRDILRTHLKFNCKNVYRPSNLDEISERIREHISEKDRIKKEMDDIKEKLKQAEERAKSSDEVAKKAQQEYINTLNNLISQQAQKEEKIAKLVADQMNSKISEIKEGYGKVISSLQSTIENLNTRLNEERER